MINVLNITKIYKDGTLANNSINLHVPKSDIVGLIGPNGAGKTTLIRQIVGLLKPTSGEIFIDGQLQNRGRKETSKHIAFFNQKTAMLEAHTAFEVIYYTGVYRGLGKADAQNQANELIEYFGLSSDIKKRLNCLSGGQTKLVMLAATFIGNYPLVILDEPTNDLDPLNRNRLWTLVNRFNHEYNSTFIIASHNLSELETVARTIAIIKDGKIVDYDDIQSLKKKYSNGYQIAVQCEFNEIESLVGKITYPYSIENNNEIFITANEENLSEIAQNILLIIREFNAEMKIYHTTLSNIYQTVQEKEISV